jgi:hypothetical protein
MLYIYFCDQEDCDVHAFFQGGGYIFEFDNVGDRELCRDFVGNAH